MTTLGAGASAVTIEVGVGAVYRSIEGLSRRMGRVGRAGSVTELGFAWAVRAACWAAASARVRWSAWARDIESQVSPRGLGLVMFQRSR